MKAGLKCLVLIVCATMIQSCSTFKKVFKLKDSQRLKTISEVRIDSSRKTINKTIITIKEKADTVVRTPEATVKEATYLNMDSLVNGMMAIKNDLVDVSLQLDPKTGILSAVAIVKPQSVYVNVDKITTIANDVLTDIAVAKQKNESLNIREDHTTIKRSPDYIAIAIGLFVGILTLTLAIYLFKKFK